VPPGEPYLLKNDVMAGNSIVGKGWPDAGGEPIEFFMDLVRKSGSEKKGEPRGPVVGHGRWGQLERKYRYVCEGSIILKTPKRKRRSRKKLESMVADEGTKVPSNGPARKNAEVKGEDTSDEAGDGKGGRGGDSFEHRGFVFPTGRLSGWTDEVALFPKKGPLKGGNRGNSVHRDDQELNRWT